MEGSFTSLTKVFKNLLVWFCFATLLAVTIGCATTVDTTMQKPAKYAEASGLRRVASLGFEGSKYKDQVNAGFETMLVNHYFDGEPYFTVADRVRTVELMGEMKRSLGAELDSSTAIKFGKKIGVQGIYFGDITSQHFSTKNVTMSDSYCKKYEGKKCKKYGTRKIRCKERTAHITLIPRLINVETGRVVYRQQHTGEAKSTACRGDSSKDDQTLFNEALDITIANIRNDIAPSTSVVSVELMDETSNLVGQDAKRFESGLEFSKAGRMDRACEIWRSLNQRVQSSDNSLLYNVAVCTEINGNLNGALEMYTLVDRRLLAPDNMVNAALKRVQSSLRTKASIL